MCQLHFSTCRARACHQPTTHLRTTAAYETIFFQSFQYESEQFAVKIDLGWPSNLQIAPLVTMGNALSEKSEKTMSSHFPLPKFALVKWTLTVVALAQNSLPSNSFLLSQMLINVALKLAMSSHLPFPKSSLSSLRLSQMARQVIDSEPKTKLECMDAPSFFPSQKGINLIPNYWKYR